MLLFILLLCNIIYIIVILYLVSCIDNCEKFKVIKKNESNKNLKNDFIFTI